MRPVRTLIVDDEPLARRRIRKILEKHTGVEIVGEATNGATAIRAIGELSPELVMLDVQMPGKDGFDVVKAVAGPAMPAIIFVTAHDEHAVRAFEVQAIDYVLKPVVEERVLTAVGRAIAQLREHRDGEAAAQVAKLLEAVERARGEGRMAVRGDRGVKLVPVSEIQWVEADADLVRIHTARGTLTHRATMAEMVSQLPAASFVRIHRSAIVNVTCISEIQPLFKGDYVVVLKNGTQVRSGQTYRAEVQKLMGR